MKKTIKKVVKKKVVNKKDFIDVDTRSYQRRKHEIMEAMEKEKAPKIVQAMGFSTNIKKLEDTNIVQFNKYPVQAFFNKISSETDYVTTRDIKFYINMGYINVDCKILKGFETDLASIPKPLMWFVQRDENFILMASVIHDYLIEHTAYRTADINRTFKDIMFFVIRKKLKNKLSKRIKAHLCYWAVCFYFLFIR